MQRSSFQIIPVIDLMAGQVVHAKFGQRNHYQPIKSRLCASSEALDIVAGLLKLYPFNTLYIADIDAILDNGHHDALVTKISENFPNLKLWLDSGKHASSCKALQVLGSESFLNLETYFCIKKPHVLSLDFSVQGAMGITELHDEATHWPGEVICMTLNAVGSGEGVDVARLQQMLAINKCSKIYAAGGVRNTTDIQTLASMGISGVLLASALHNQQIKSDDISQFYVQ